MKDRCEENVLEAEGGITSYMPEGTELPAVMAGVYVKKLSVYTDEDGNKAVVPRGWTVSRAKTENIIWGKNVGLVIYRIPQAKLANINWEDPGEVEFLKRKYDQLSWVPVNLLKPNGTIDGVLFDEKFGRRNYQNDEFSKMEFHEPLTLEYATQIESVKKYGGFYISRYDICKSLIGKPRSVKMANPWVDIDLPNVKEVISTIEDNETVQSHLTFGAEYDSVLEWFIETGARSLYEIAENSINWGNQRSTTNFPRGLVRTGCKEEWCTNNIYDFSGNVDEWTQERKGDSCYAIRGGNYNWPDPVCYRFSVPSMYHWCGTGFRFALYIK